MTTETRSGKTLLAACQSGDKEACKNFYHAHIDKVFGLCVKILRNREKAKDAAQESFLKIFSYLHRFRMESDVSTWIYRITSNVCYDMYKADTPGLESSFDEETHPSGQAGAHGRPIESTVREILQNINKDLAQTFWLFTVEGLSQKQIAEILEISIPTVKMRLGRVRELIQKKITRNDI